jgi:hypothetical protein
LQASQRPTTTAEATRTRDKVDALMRDDRPTTKSELCAAIALGKPAVMTTIRELFFRNVCAIWVPKILTVEHKTA